VAAELRLGTRGSALALWQANAVAARMASQGGPACRIVVIKTTGDQLQEAPLSEAGGKRLFVKEIEDALLRDVVDLAVHSSKDMPAILPDGLAIGGVLPREDPLDAVVLPAGAVEASPNVPPPSSVEDLVALLGETPSIGTGSVRRIAQLARLFPDARFEPIRGNLDTRLKKLDEGRYRAIVLAAAGLRRLGLAGRITMALPASACIPAPGQGIVAIEVRADDRRVREVVSAMSDASTAVLLDAERALVEALGGGCQTPVGALATWVQAPNGSADGELDLIAGVVATDGSRAVRGHDRGSAADAVALGRRVAAKLLEDGAGELLGDAGNRSED
jgi:hydroxymethylbilane synthase